MGFLQDNLIPFFKKREIVFLESCKESEKVCSFLFEKGEDLTWKAGQYGLFSITHKKIKNDTRPFSVASAPVENIVRITTTISNDPSDFKQALLELKKGMKVSMRGPVGPFYLSENRPTLLIAGGIGITPFRSILKQIEAGKKENQIQLLYLDSKKSYLFKDELDEIAERASIRITYLDSKDELENEIEKFASLNQSDGQYFIAGPKGMVDAVSNYLKSRNVAKRNIKKDAFFGY